MSSAERPLKVQAAATTGTGMAGKMSAGVRMAARTPPMTIMTAITTKV
jgi:hypothetical protein